MPRRKYRRSSSGSTRKYLVAAGIVLLIGLTGFLVYHKYKKTSPPSTASTPASIAPPQSKVDLSPATQAEKDAARDTPTTSQNTSSGGSKTVTPFITSATASETRAYVQGVIEDGGTCTATYTHGADVVTATSKGAANASYTNCAPMTLSGPVNISGTWSVVVSYSSSTSSGKSQPSTFEVK